jgi:hypothetical protein
MSLTNVSSKAIQSASSRNKCGQHCLQPGSHSPTSYQLFSGIFTWNGVEERQSCSQCCPCLFPEDGVWIIMALLGFSKNFPVRLWAPGSLMQFLALNLVPRGALHGHLFEITL